MKQNPEHSATVEHSAESQSLPPFLNPDVTLMILTWVTFLALLAVLYKYAWKPILNGLDKREDNIRKGIAAAEKSQEELARIDETRTEIIEEAEAKAKYLIERGRKGATEAAKVIENKAKEEAQITLGNARYEIKANKEKAHMELREESADLAISLAGKIIDADLDEAKHRKLIDKLIKDFRPEEYDET